MDPVPANYWHDFKNHEDEFSSLPVTENTALTSKVHEKDSGTVPASIHHDPAESVWSSHSFSVEHSSDFIDKG